MPSTSRHRPKRPSSPDMHGDASSTDDASAHEKYTHLANRLLTAPDRPDMSRYDLLVHLVLSDRDMNNRLRYAQLSDAGLRERSAEDDRKRPGRCRRRREKRRARAHTAVSESDRACSGVSDARDTSVVSDDVRQHCVVCGFHDDDDNDAAAGDSSSFSSWENVGGLHTDSSEYGDSESESDSDSDWSSF